MKNIARIMACSLLFSFTFISAEKDTMSFNKTIAFCVRTAQVWFTLQVAPQTTLTCPVPSNNAIPAILPYLVFPAPINTCPVFKPDNSRAVSTIVHFPALPAPRGN